MAENKRKIGDGYYPLPACRPPEKMKVAVSNNELGVIKSMMKEVLDQNQSLQSKMDVMSDKMHHLEAKNDCLERSLEGMACRLKYHEILLKNQKWEYSAEPPPSSYWVSIRHSQHNVHAARSFLNEIKRSTCGMRNGDDDCDDGRVYLGSSSFLPYDDVFMPHWIEFAHALKGFRHFLKCLPEQSTSLLQLRNVDLSRDVLDLLEEALQDVHFDGLILQSNSLGHHGLCFAFRYAQKNPVLKELHLEKNPIQNTIDLQLLCDMIRAHPTLESLMITDCNGGKKDNDITGNGILSSTITGGKSKLKNIDLSGNDIRLGGRFLCDFLSGNPLLQKLELSRNKLDDEDASWIASALKGNTNLKYLGLWRNPIKEKGCSQLCKAEFDDTSLNSASGSNHTCLIIYPDNSRGINETSGQGTLRAKKVYSILSSRNGYCSNSKLLDEVQVEFLPDMLVSIQNYSEYHLRDDSTERDNNDVLALSVVYEIMRWWDKALSVYE